MNSSAQRIRGKIKATCYISGVNFETPIFHFLPDNPVLHVYEEARIAHPIFHVPQAALLRVASTILDLEEKAEAEITGYSALAAEKEEAYGLLLLALWNSTGLISYSTPALLPDLAEVAIRLKRTIAITTWLSGRGKTADIPHFHCDHSTKGNLYLGFLKELEDFRESIAEKRKRTDLNIQMEELSVSAKRKELYGGNIVTPKVIERVCHLIGWTFPYQIKVATLALSSDPITVLNKLDSSEITLKDLSDLLLDIELLDWQSVIRTSILALLRNLINTIHTFRPLSAEEKTLFTDVIGQVENIFTATKKQSASLTFGASSPEVEGTKTSYGKSGKVILLELPSASSTRPDLFTNPLAGRADITKGTSAPWKKFLPSALVTSDLSAVENAIKGKLSFKEIAAAKLAPSAPAPAPMQQVEKSSKFELAPITDESGYGAPHYDV